MIYTATILPYRICFHDDPSKGWIIFDYILDGMFWLDLIINFFTSYINDEGKYEANILKVMK